MSLKPYCEECEAHGLRRGEPPAGTPEPIRLKLDTTLRTILAQADMQKKLKDLGLTPAYAPGPDVLAAIRKELPLMRKVAATAHMPAQ